MRTEAINALLKNYAAIVQALEQISEESHDEYGRRTNGLLSQLERFDRFIGLKLFHLVFSGTEQTSINLQRKDTSVQEALACAELAISYLKRLRTDDSFSFTHQQFNKLKSSLVSHHYLVTDNLQRD